MARQNVLKNEKKKSIKAYTIISSVVALLAVTLVGVLVYLYISLNTDDYENLFSSITYTTATGEEKTVDLTQFKINYNQIDDILKDENTATNIFIFAYDESYWNKTKYEELEEDNPVRVTYEKTEKAFTDFIKALMENHEKYLIDEKKDLNNYCEFYIINTSLTGNSSFLSDEKYGGSSDSSLNVPTMVHIYGEEYKDKDKNEEFTLSGGNGDYSQFTLVLKEIRKYILDIN